MPDLISFKLINLFISNNIDNNKIISALARLDNLYVNNEKSGVENMVGFVAGGYEVYLDLSGAVDLEKEKEV